MYFGKYVNAKGQETEDCCYQTCHLKIAIKARWAGDQGNERPSPTSGDCLVTAVDTSLSPLPLRCCWIRNLRSSELRLALGASSQHWTNTHLDIQIYPCNFKCCCPLAFLKCSKIHWNNSPMYIYHICKIYIFLSVSAFACQTLNLDMFSKYWNYSMNQPGSAHPYELWVVTMVSRSGQFLYLCAFLTDSCINPNHNNKSKGHFKLEITTISFTENCYSSQAEYTRS